MAGPCGRWSPVRFRAEGGSGPAEQIVQFAVQIDELGLLAGRDDLERAEEESGNRVQRGLEVRLAERGGQRDVEHPVVFRGRRPDPDVTFAGRLGQALGEQVPREDPLHGLVHADMKGHPDRVRVIGPVVETGRERNAIVFWNHESEAELGCDDLAAVHCLTKPLPCPVPERRASPIVLCRLRCTTLTRTPMSSPGTSSCDLGLTSGSKKLARAHGGRLRFAGRWRTFTLCPIGGAYSLPW